MKNHKIVKRIAALALVATIPVGMISCAKKNKNQTDFYEDEEVFFVEGSQSENGILNVQGSQETVGKIGVYRPVDFANVTNLVGAYDELLALREEYFKVMKYVCVTKLGYSKEEKAAAIYNVIRIDNDLSGLMVKISDNKRNETKSDYLDVQVEKLEGLKNDINELRTLLEESEKIWQNDIDKIDEIEAEKILKVKRYNDLAL
ncbi:MAG: hypothetical protein IKY10_00040, partial [Clostridia bacterium]|nr:hypothetical protein [Clostridia bacterium]